MKSQKALVAIARKMLVIIYNVLKTGLPFDPTKNLQALLPDWDTVFYGRFSPTISQVPIFVVNE